MPSRHPPVRFAVIAALAACGLALSTGCVRHHAAVTTPPPAAVADDGQRPATFIAARSRTIERDRAMPIVADGPLPADFQVTAWRRTADGPLERADLRVRTDLPWWQRFPADLVADFLPIDAVVTHESSLELQAVPRVDLDAFLVQAEHDGYSRRTGPAK